MPPARRRGGPGAGVAGSPAQDAAAGDVQLAMRRFRAARDEGAGREAAPGEGSRWIRSMF